MKAIFLIAVLIVVFSLLSLDKHFRHGAWQVVKTLAPPVLAALFVAWLILNLSQFTTGRIF
jgi:hypothetical protein